MSVALYPLRSRAQERKNERTKEPRREKLHVHEGTCAGNDPCSGCFAQQVSVRILGWPRVPISTTHAKSLCKHIFVLPSGLSPKDLTQTACLPPKGTESACHQTGGFLRSNSAAMICLGLATNFPASAQPVCQKLPCQHSLERARFSMFSLGTRKSAVLQSAWFGLMCAATYRATVLS